MPYPPAATTNSRSTSRNGSSCAPSRLQQPGRHGVFPPFRPPLSHPHPEHCIMPEISLTQTPAHVRHGSNIGQPLTRRDGVLKVKGEARYAADNHPPGMLHAALAVSSIGGGRVSYL